MLFPQEGVNGLSRGISVFLRSLSLISLSVGYILVIDPYDLINTLMQQFGLPHRAGFALFAAWNAVPLLARDLRIIEKARAIRTGRKRQGFKELSGTPVVLLSGAIRHGERVSLSMAARGIEAPGKRTFSRKSYWRKADTLLHCRHLVSISVSSALVKYGHFVFELG